MCCSLGLKFDPGLSYHKRQHRRIAGQTVQNPAYCLCPAWLGAVDLLLLLKGPVPLQMMAQYPRTDPYLRSRYDDHGIDAKIVIMGNTGQSITLRITHTHSQPIRRCRKDQSSSSLYPEQIRPKKHDFNHRCLLRNQEGLRRRTQSQTAAVGHCRSRAFSQHGAFSPSR